MLDIVVARFDLGTAGEAPARPGLLVPGVRNERLEAGRSHHLDSRRGIDELAGAVSAHAVHKNLADTRRDRSAALHAPAPPADRRTGIRLQWLGTGTGSSHPRHGGGISEAKRHQWNLTRTSPPSGLSQMTCAMEAPGVWGAQLRGCAPVLIPQRPAVVAPGPRLGPSWAPHHAPLMNVAKYQVWVRSVRRVVRRRCRWQVDAIWRSRGGRREE